MGWIRLILNANLSKYVVPRQVTLLKPVGITSHILQYSAFPKLPPGQVQIKNTLKVKFPDATRISVEDISDGCGDIYEIYVDSMDFAGKCTAEQHKLVSSALAKVTDMPELRIFTSVPTQR